MPTSHARVEITIERPLSEVFEYLANYANVVHWQEGILSASQATPGEPGVGTRVSYRRKVVGKEFSAEAEMTLFEKHQRYRLASKSGPFGYLGGYDFKPLGPECTQVAYSGEIKSSGFASLLGGLVARNFQKQMSGDLARLKTLLESR